MNIWRTLLKKGEGVEQLTVVAPELTVREAYQVQLATIEKALGAGETITGKKNRADVARDAAVAWCG